MSLHSYLNIDYFNVKPETKAKMYTHTHIHSKENVKDKIKTFEILGVFQSMCSFFRNYIFKHELKTGEIGL